MARLAKLLAPLLFIAAPAFAAPPSVSTPNRQGEYGWIDGFRWNSQFKPIAYAVTVMNGQDIRIQLNRGDVAWSDGQAGITYANRGEFSCWSTVPFGKAVTFEDDVMIEPGPVSDRGFMILFQPHQDDAVQGSPPFAVDIMPNVGKTAELVQIDAMYNTVSPHDKNNNIVRNWPTVAFTRGVVHHLKAAFVDGHGAANAGSIHVEWDGAVILDQPGITTGYAGATYPDYPKFGMYSGNPVQNADQQLVVHHYSPDLTIAP